jgi:hypothetical protein
MTIKQAAREIPIDLFFVNLKPGGLCIRRVVR